MIKEIGKNPSAAQLENIEKSRNYTNGSFQNIHPTPMKPKDVSYFKIMKEMWSRPKTVKPPHEIPNVKTDLKNITAHKPTIVWFGHSSYFLQLGNFKILIDPVFSGNAAPVNFFGKAFPGADEYDAENFPDLDLLILTHDHYDHLDYKTIKKIHPKVKKIITSLGVASHLNYWGVDSEKITELDWWTETIINKNLKITATPARHFSGRGFTRYKTFWSSFVLEFAGYRIFVGGDSGYDNQFNKIGDHFKYFDLAFLECGQYGKYWPHIHMFPEQTVQAAIDLNAEILFPVHWSKFVLSSHPWNEPIKRMTAEAKKRGQKYVSPKIGQPYVLGEDFQQEKWWEL